MAAWSFEEVLKRGGIISRTVHTELFFFMWVLKKKNLAHALTVTSSANIILKVWLTNRAFFPKLKKFKFFSFFLLFDFSALEDKKKRDRSSSSSLKFQQMFISYVVY